MVYDELDIDTSFEEARETDVPDSFGLRGVEMTDFDDTRALHAIDREHMSTTRMERETGVPVEDKRWRLCLRPKTTQLPHARQIYKFYKIAGSDDNNRNLRLETFHFEETRQEKLVLTNNASKNQTAEARVELQLESVTRS